MSDIIGGKHLVMVLVTPSLYMWCPLTQIERINMFLLEHDEVCLQRKETA